MRHLRKVAHGAVMTGPDGGRYVVSGKSKRYLPRQQDQAIVALALRGAGHAPGSKEHAEHFAELEKAVKDRHGTKTPEEHRLFAAHHDRQYEKHAKGTPEKSAHAKLYFIHRALAGEFT